MVGTIPFSLPLADRTMRTGKPRSRIHRAILYMVIFLITLAGSMSGGVLCFGSNHHIHIEVTFNGVDCGHFPLAALETTDGQVLTAESPLPPSPCYACTDIPLALPDYLRLQQSGFNAYSHNQNATQAMAVLPFFSFQFFPRGFHPDHLLKLPPTSYSSLSRILGSTLRI